MWDAPEELLACWSAQAGASLSLTTLQTPAHPSEPQSILQEAPRILKSTDSSLKQVLSVRCPCLTYSLLSTCLGRRSLALPTSSAWALFGRIMCYAPQCPQEPPMAGTYLTLNKDGFFSHPKLWNDCQQGTSCFQSSAPGGSSVCVRGAGHVCSAPRGAAWKAGEQQPARAVHGAISKYLSGPFPQDPRMMNVK